MSEYHLNHLREIESESIYVLREVAAQFENPVLLFSGGKDSIVMTHLARKAFSPGKLPFPLLHVDTGHNFEETIEFRDKLVSELNAELIVGSVQDSIDSGRCKEETGPNPSRNGLQITTLLDSLAEHKFDAAMGGARRDEEKARAKERFFSFRDEFGQWDPKNQRPELWNIYNSEINEGESIRVFPLSNWTEVDIWEYIKLENIDIVPIYYAQERDVVIRHGMIIPINPDIEYTHAKEGEEVKRVKCRFRSLGCMPCTGAVESDATTLDEIIQEALEAKKSERENRLIDLGSDSSMEDKKKEGYF